VTALFLLSSVNVYVNARAPAIIYYFFFKKSIDKSRPLCYTIIVPREMRITAEGTHQTRKRRAPRGASGDANRNRRGGKEQYHLKCHEKIFQRNVKNPLTTNAECAIL
jgi:hypothetical protein